MYDRCIEALQNYGKHLIFTKVKFSFTVYGAGINIIFCKIK